MRTIDLSPLYRSTIGFDRVGSLLDTLTRSEQSQSSYPPYNIEVIGENQYRITMAVAGFSESDIQIETKDNVLTVSASKKDQQGERKFLHQGIAERNFERRFQLADHVRAENASLKDGLLHVELFREVPEAIKPRTIPINGNSGANSSITQLQQSA